MQNLQYTAPCILLAEDEEALAVMLQYNLEKSGFRVAVASDGEDALAQVEAVRPDFLVLDWMLPKLSGLEVCRRLRARPETRVLPILMLTARGSDGDLRRCTDAGADHYLLKPFALGDLTAFIQRALYPPSAGLAQA